MFDLVAAPDNREKGNYSSMSHNVRRKRIELVTGSDLTSSFFRWQSFPGVNVNESTYDNNVVLNHLPFSFLYILPT